MIAAKATAIFCAALPPWSPPTAATGSNGSALCSTAKYAPAVRYSEEAAKATIRIAALGTSAKSTTPIDGTAQPGKHIQPNENPVAEPSSSIPILQQKISDSVSIHNSPRELTGTTPSEITPKSVSCESGAAVQSSQNLATNTAQNHAIPVVFSTRSPSQESVEKSYKRKSPETKLIRSANKTSTPNPLPSAVLPPASAIVPLWQKQRDLRKSFYQVPKTEPVKPLAIENADEEFGSLSPTQPNEELANVLPVKKKQKTGGTLLRPINPLAKKDEAKQNVTPERPSVKVKPAYAKSTDVCQ
jgi:hypothetical protein